jgi:hypothetical protein
MMRCAGETAHRCVNVNVNADLEGTHGALLELDDHVVKYAKLDSMRGRPD